MSKLNAIVAPHPQVVAQMLPAEAVLLLPSKGEVKVLNDVGARIWALLDGKRTLSEIIELVCAEYAVLQAQAKKDVLEFVGELAQRNLVVLSFPTS